MTLDKRLDAACAALEAREPWFAEEYEAARNLLRTAHVGADCIRYPHGIVVRNGRCGCLGACQCLHELGFKMYAEEVVDL